MSLSAVRGSTQDGTSGTQVAQAANESSGAGALQATAPVGNKTTYAEVSRTGVTTADTATTDLSTTGFAGSAGANLGDAENALTLAVRATCDAAGKTLTGRVVLYDGGNNPLAVSESLSFTSDAALRLSAAGNYVCPRQLIDCGQARKFRFYVDAVTGGTWAVAVRPI